MQGQNDRSNMILIGMPGAGKSTIGILLAKFIGKEFVDTDILVQNQEKKLLHEIIHDEGIKKFLEKEESVIMSLNPTDTVIATGGSVVLSERAMNHLKFIGTILYLDLDIKSLINRIKNIETRGIVREIGQSFEDIYKIRSPLYEQYSNKIINCKNKNHEQIINEIVAVLKNN